MPKINLLQIRRGILIVFLLLGIFTAGYFLGASGLRFQSTRPAKFRIERTLPPDRQDIDFSLFWKVWDILSSAYFDKSKLDWQKMVYGAISGMVSSLGDPYTVFLAPSENKVVQEDLGGSFEGVGIQIGFKGTQLAVIAPLPGSPAEAAGAKAGDFIIGIKDEGRKLDRGTVGISLAEAVKDIRGPAGTKVTLTLLRDSSPQAITVEVIRQKLSVPSVALSFLGEGEGVAHVRLMKFGGETNNEWQKAIGEISQKRVKGVILDVRNNPGGYLQSAVDIAGEFLKTGTTVVIEEKGNGQKNQYRVERIGKLTKTPLVVLINGGSASASEILAGALRDEKKVMLIGETTFGKGTIQEPQEIEGGAGLHVTVARWLTPAGFWVNEKGLEPDVKIKDDPETGEDEQLQKAIALLSQ